MARILIVEDEGILAFKTRVDLEEMGHEVVGIVDNANEAIEIALKEKPDLILMDIVLKGDLDGIEAGSDERRLPAQVRETSRKVSR